MNRTVRVYRLTFSSDTSSSERLEMCILLEKSGAMVSQELSTQHSGPLGLLVSNEIDKAQVTTMSDYEDEYMHKIIGDNAAFKKSTLTLVS